METTNSKGNKGLANAIADVMNKNYFVFLPISDTTCVDLILINSEIEVKKSQVKYRAIDKNGVITIPTETVVNGKKIKVDVSKTDIWIIFCPNNKKCYYISTKDLQNKKSLALRIEEPMQVQNNMNFAKNYEDIELAWNK